jgi:hypothetical protein
MVSIAISSDEWPDDLRLALLLLMLEAVTTGLFSPSA